MKTRIRGIMAAACVLGQLTAVSAQSEAPDQYHDHQSNATIHVEVDTNRAIVVQSTDEMVPAHLVEQILAAQEAVNTSAPPDAIQGAAPNVAQPLPGSQGGRFNIQRPGTRGPQSQTQTAQTRTVLEPPAAGVNGTNELRMNFRGAPIERVLAYMSDAAGFIIELNTRVNGQVDIWSNTPVTRDEAVDLLNSALNKNGYAAIRNGRTLRIMTREEALRSDKPVRIGNDPNLIPKNDEIVTQIIPIRFVEAEQLMRDISPMLSPRANIVANQAGNSIVITDTQANIHHVVEIIRAIDSSAEDVTEVRVFPLQFHDPVEVAALLTSLFAEQGGSAQSPVRFGGGGGGGQGQGGGFARFFGGGGFNQGGGNRGNNNAGQDRIRRRARVVAVADQRTGSVVVTAARDLIDQIDEMIGQIDRESPKVARVSVVRLENADTHRVAQVLQDMFQSNNRNTRAAQNSALMTRSQSSQNQMGASFRGNFGGGGAGFQGGQGGGRGGF